MRSVRRGSEPSEAGRRSRSGRPYRKTRNTRIGIFPFRRRDGPGILRQSPPDQKIIGGHHPSLRFHLAFPSSTSACLVVVGTSSTMAPAAVKRKRPQDGDGNRGQSTASSSKKPAVAKSRSRDSRKLKRDTEQAEIDQLESGVASFTPPKDYSRFDHLPLSRKTLQGKNGACWLRRVGQ